MIIKLFSDDLGAYIDEFKEDITQTLKDYGIKVNNTNILEQAQWDIDYYLEEFKNAVYAFDNLNEYDCIEVYASLGLWHGVKHGVKHFKTLSEAIFKYCEDINNFYFKTKNSTLILEAIHHDGKNIFKFYMIRNNKKHAIKYKHFEGVL